MILPLFFLGIIAIPFNDMMEPSFMGELAHEFSVLFFLLALGLFALRLFDSQERGKVLSLSKQPGARFLTFALGGFLLVVLASLAANAVDIAEGYFRGRWAFSKFFTSNLVFFYGFGLAFLSYTLARAAPWRDSILRPAALSAIIVAFFALLEAATLFIGSPFSEIQDIFSVVVHSGGSPFSGGIGPSAGGGWTDARISSVCFEPPYLALFSGFLWPWVYLGFRSCANNEKNFYGLALFSATLLVFVSNSRTALLLLGGNLAVLGLLRFALLPPQPQRVDWGQAIGTAIKAGAIVFAVLALFYSETLAHHLIVGDFFSGEKRISNISRLSSNVAAYRIFIENPIFGAGLGQYGFKAAAHMPYWAWYSWEINDWFTNPNAVWPPVFNLYGRIGAELGSFGLLFWIVLWSYAARLVIRASKTHHMQKGVLPVQAYALVMSCCCVLFAGLPMDSVRMPYIWITLGFLAAYLEKVTEALASPLTPPQDHTVDESAPKTSPSEARRLRARIRRRR